MEADNALQSDAERRRWASLVRLSVLGLVLLTAASGAAAQSTCHAAELLPGTQCTVTVDGTAAWLDVAGTLSIPNAEPVQIPLPDQLYIESARAHDKEGTTLLVLEVTDVESSSTVLATLDHKTNKLKWSRELPAFNPSPPLLSKDALYIGAIGLVAKVRLSDGGIVWLHRDLYEQDTQAFNAFQKPRLAGSVVVFPEDKVPAAKHSGLREVRVDDRTGKLLSK
jgi:hypothetical protein